jgi:hypothetical protein
MIALTVASPTVTVAHLKVRALYGRKSNKYNRVPVLDCVWTTFNELEKFRCTWKSSARRCLKKKSRNAAVTTTTHLFSKRQANQVEYLFQLFLQDVLRQTTD